MDNIYPELLVECNDLRSSEIFPEKYTHRGEEISPEFIIRNLSPNGKTITIIFDDLDHPMHHWRIWNLPAIDIIPENLSGDKILSNMGNAIPKNKYRGPNPPKGIRHKYQFNIFVLDCELKIKSNSNKKQLEKAMEGHIIQYGFINGYFE
jgi:Raf kinase inhibitor-like YbhB/YbcL family protein